MKQTISFITLCLSIGALLEILTVHANNVTPTLVYRSQGFHGDRQRNVGELGNINLFGMDSLYGTMDMSLGYLRSFRSQRIAECLFGDDLICNDSCANTIKVQGSEVTTRDPKAWLADYLYLNCEYDGSFSINPVIQNVVIDLNVYLGFNGRLENMYFRMYGPINWTKWQTKFCPNDPETVLTTSCSAGYFTPTGTEILLESIADYFCGNAPEPVDFTVVADSNETADVANSIIFQPLKFAKMPKCDKTKVGFADLRAELGWNFLQNEDYHLGIGIHAAAPTGNKRKAAFAMNPVVGNGNHWELGGTVHGHYIFWRSENEEKQFGFYIDALITHLFKTREQRTFDLLCKDNSRYMLASKFTQTVTDGLHGRATAGTVTSGSTAALAQFNDLYAPVANLTTADVNVSIKVQADITALINFTTHNLSWDIGYNFWGRSCEDIECLKGCDCNSDSIFVATNKDTWALKGDARMFGFAAADDGGIVNQNDPIHLSATQSQATIHKGANADFADATLTDVTRQNGGVDNSQFAIVGNESASDVRVIHTPTTQGGFNANSDQIKTSIQPIFLEKSDVALQATRGLSNTIFTHVSYIWDRENWIPSLGIGGSAEFGVNGRNSSSCDHCVDCSLSQWAIWVKGGVAFD